MSELIHINFWGRLTDQFGRDMTVEASEVDTIESLIASLGEAVSDGSIRVILNDTHLTNNASLNAGDRIEFLPPVGGG